MTVDTRDPNDPARLLERKIRLSRWAMTFERLWPRLWLAAGLVALFIVVSLAGVWSAVPPLGHKALLAGFAIALLGLLIYAARVKTPTREEALRRIELRSAVPHRPASSYEDMLSVPGTDPATQRIWQAHRQRLARQIGGLKVGNPAPRTHRFDPFAVRAALLIATFIGLGLVGDSARDRLSAAFRLGGGGLDSPTARLDAWVTPPAYTSRPPVMLADGSTPPGAQQPAPAAGTKIEIPERSVLIVRASGQGIGAISLELAPQTGAAEKIDGKPIGGSAEVAEVRLELRRSGTIKVREGSREVARWAFEVTPDLAPRIALTRGLMRDDVLRELTFTGRVFTAAEGVGYGCVTHVDPEPHAAALTLAREIATKSPDAVRGAKRLYNAALEGGAAELLRAESAEQGRLIGSANQMEAVMANLEKRAPLFRDPA